MSNGYGAAGRRARREGRRARGGKPLDVNTEIPQGTRRGKGKTTTTPRRGSAPGPLPPRGTGTARTSTPPAPRSTSSRGTGSAAARAAGRSGAVKNPGSQTSGSTPGTRVGTGVTTITRGKNYKPSGSKTTKTTASKLKSKATPKRSRKSTGASVNLMSPAEARRVREERMKSAVAAGRKKQSARKKKATPKKKTSSHKRAFGSFYTGN